jgi:hypothetical protein
MSLPNYWINLEELKDVFIKVLNENSINVKGAVVEGSHLDINGGLDGVESIIQELINVITEQNGLTSANDSEVSRIASLISQRLDMQYKQTEDARVATGLILGEELEIRGMLQELLELLSTKGKSKNTSLRLEVTNINSQFLLTFTPDANIILKNIFVYQDKYDFQDNWSFKINDSYIFENIYTKYTEEQKNFNSKMTVNAGDILTFEFNNNSSKQKIINYDIEYLFVL